MRAGDEAFDALRAAIDELAEGEAAELVAEARIEARAKVRTILAEAMAHALLERSQAQLSATPAAAPEPVPEPPLPAPAPQVHDAPEELGWYVYGVVGADSLDLSDLPLRGADARHQVQVLRQGDLAALASHVPLSEFGEQTLRESLNDVAWLEGTARGHEHVLDEVRAVTTVIPMRLCTVYRSEDSVTEMLTREHSSLTEALSRLTAKTEWGLKIFVEPSAAERAAKQTSHEAGRLDAELEDASAGSAYIRRKQLDVVLREQTDGLIDGCVDEAHSRLSALSVEALSNPLQRPEASGHSGEMVLNGVYLLDDAATEEFHAAVAVLIDKHGAHGFEFEATGPWPPYNFVKSSIEAAW